MKWAEYTVRMKDGRLLRGAETEKHGGRRKRGRPQLRREDRLKRDLRKAEEEEKWREKHRQLRGMEENNVISCTAKLTASALQQINVEEQTCFDQMRDCKKDNGKQYMKCHRKRIFDT